MPRFSLLSDAALVTADVYRDEGKERYAAPSPSSSRSSESINTELTYSDDDDDVVDDEPLSYSIGRTRYALDTQQESLAQYQRRRWGYHVEDFDDIGRNDSQHLHVQKYPPVNDSYYLNADTAPTAALMRLSLVASAYYDDQKKDEEMDKLAHLLRASVLVEDDTQHLRDKRQHQRILALQEETSAKQRIQQEMRAVQMRLDEEHKQAVAALQMLLQSNDRAAAEIRSAEQKVQEEEQAEQERLAKEHQEWEKEEEAEQARLQERLVASIAEERKVEQEDQVHREAEQIKLKKEAAATEHVSKANKLRAQLIELEKSVQAFETSSIVSRRRLQMKKIVNGRVNTLAENVDKIGEVAAEVLAAISLARQEDAQAKEQPGATPDMSLGKRYILNLLSTKVIVRVQAEGFNGQRGDGFPLANMLALVSVEAKEIVPILSAHIFTVCPTAVPTLPHPKHDATEENLMESLGMLRLKDGQFESFERFLSRTEGVISLVANIMASEPADHVLMGGHEGAVKWLTRFLDLLPPAPQSPLPLLTAPVLDAFLTGAGHMLANKHPDDFRNRLDSISNDVSNRLDESSIGMPSATRLRKTIGKGFEGFKKNLPSRALPELYFGANASVGYGHPAASSSPFAASSSSISGTNTANFVSPSQASPFGRPPLPNQQPGFGAAGFVTSSQSSDQRKSNNSRPLCHFFAEGRCKNGDNCKFSHENPDLRSVSSTPAPFRRTSAAPSASPFGSAAPGPSPFGGASAPGPSPFGGASAPGPLPFGGASTPGLSPFGSTAPSPSPFGAVVASPSPSPFGASAPSPSPFGGQAPGPSPFGTTSNSLPFGASSASQPSPFSGGLAPSPSPFGLTAPSPSFFGTTAQSPSPFGSTPSNSAPFVAVSAASPSPFGSTAAYHSPFGTPAPAPSPFGAAAGGSASAPSPFGAVASGSAPFGSLTAISHSTFGSTTAGSSPFGSAPTSSPFGSAVQGLSSFGAGLAPSPSPFGSIERARFGGAPVSNPSPPASSISPFGSSVPSLLPFGGGATPIPSPFGLTPSNPSPFGSAAAPAPFGLGSQLKSSPFGSAPSSSPLGSAPNGSGTPFGGQQQASPFSGQQQANSFGGTQQAAPFSGQQQMLGSSSGFGGDQRAPCRFFAEGRCRYGNTCRFSHAAPQTSNSTFSNPFGGPRR